MGKEEASGARLGTFRIELFKGLVLRHIHGQKSPIDFPKVNETSRIVKVKILQDSDRDSEYIHRTSGKMGMR